MSTQDVFAALADPRRRELVTLIGERGSATATELARELPVSRQAVQKQLGGLAAAGLVASRREGREVRLPPDTRADVGRRQLDGPRGRSLGRAPR